MAESNAFPCVHRPVNRYLNSASFPNKKSWGTLNGGELGKKFGVRKFQLINDFEAQGYGVLTLDSNETFTLQVRPLLSPYFSQWNLVTNQHCCTTQLYVAGLGCRTSARRPYCLHRSRHRAGRMLSNVGRRLPISVLAARCVCFGTHVCHDLLLDLGHMLRRTPSSRKHRR